MSSPSLEFALVRILIDDQSPRKPVGAGFLVTPQHVITCAHVVDEALKLKGAAPSPNIQLLLDIPLLTGQPLLRAKILRWHPANAASGAADDVEDIAVLELLPDDSGQLPVEALPVPVAVLDLDEQSFFGQRIRMCGFLAGSGRGTWVNGTLQGLVRQGRVEIHCQNQAGIASEEQDGLSRPPRQFSLAELNELRAMLTKRLNALTNDWALETRSEEKLRLLHKKDEALAERGGLDQQIKERQEQQVGGEGSEAAPEDDMPVRSGFSGTAVWAVEENAVCGMIVSVLRQGEATVAYMIPALSLLEALPAIDEFNRAANPYRGLKAFREQDARFYFGRNEAADLLRQAADRQPFTAVIGASGSGKSSLVFAGLLPMLSKQGGWLTAACRPKSQPFEELAACLIPFLYEDELERMRKAKDCAAELLAGKLSLTDLLRPIFSKNSGVRLLLIVDQFEELFTLNPDKELVRRYLEGLLAAGQSEGFAVLVTMRADFLGAAIAYDLLAEAMNKHRPIMIPPMSGQGLREAVERPALLLHVRFEPGLAELIVQDVGNEPGSLPLLEFCLSQLWEKQQRRQITHEAYKELGGVQQALAVHADTEIKDFDEQQVRQIFLKLVRPGQGTEDTRQVAALADFQEEQRGLIRQLADRRLLVTSGGADGKEETVEVVHEALIRCWKKLRQWVDKEREFLVWREKLKVLLKQWQESGELLRGLPLDQALKWRGSHENYLSEEERRFIWESEKAREKQNRRKTVNIAAVVVLIAGAMLSVVFFNQLKNEKKLRRIAEYQKVEAKYNMAKVFEEKALTEIKTADGQSDGKYKNAVLFVSAAFSQDIPTDRAIFEPESIFHLFTPTIFNLGLTNTLILNGHTQNVLSADFSPDGKRVVSAAWDKTIRIWDAANGKEWATLKGHEDTVNSAAFSPDGRRIVSASGNFSGSSNDNTIRLWDAESSKELAVLRGHEHAVFTAAYSPDGKRIVSASGDKTVRLWDAESGKEISVFKGHEGYVLSAFFSFDGRHIVSASGDKTVRLWDAESGKEVAILRGHESAVYRASFSHDNRKIVSSSDDKTIRIWDAESGKEISIITGHKNTVFDAAFSPDGRHIVSASGDKTVRIWDAENGKETSVFKEHDGYVSTAVFSSDGMRIVSASDDKTVRIWNIIAGVKDIDVSTINIHKDIVFSVSFSPDDRYIVSASGNDLSDSGDNTVQIWDAVDGKQLSVLKGHEQAVYSVAFSPDGRRIVSASKDETVRIWDVASGQELAVLKGHGSPVNYAVFSPDGKRIISSCWNATVRLWDAESGKELVVLKGHQKSVLSAAFSFDGRRIVSASYDKTVRLWDAVDGKELAVLKGHENYVNSASFSPDGRRIVSASNDNTLRLWDAESGKELAVFKGHEDYVTSASFSPDGRRIVSASEDNTVRFWDTESGKELAVLKGHEKGVNNAAFSHDGRRIVSASRDKTVRLWDLRLCQLFLKDYQSPTILYSNFIDAVKFLWELDVQGLKIVHKERAEDEMKRFGSLLAPPPPGQSKFDQVLEWAEKQQGGSGEK